MISGGATAITAESCAPANGAIDPGETVTVNFDLSNVGTANTDQPGRHVAGRPAASRRPAARRTMASLRGGRLRRRRAPFTFTAGTTCGQTITATFQLQDGATNLGTVYVHVPDRRARRARHGVLTAPAMSPRRFRTSARSTFPIIVADTGVVTDVNVKVRAESHLRRRPAVFQLISPTGIIVPLVVQSRRQRRQLWHRQPTIAPARQPCSTTRAATAISAGTAPFAGSFRPESPLSALNGETSDGMWIAACRPIRRRRIRARSVACQLEITRQRFVCCGVAGTPADRLRRRRRDHGREFRAAEQRAGSGRDGHRQLPARSTPATATPATWWRRCRTPGGVTPVTTSQNYGVVVAAGPTVSQAVHLRGQRRLRRHDHRHSASAGWRAGSWQRDLHVPARDHQHSSRRPSRTPRRSRFRQRARATTGAPATPYPSNITVSGAPTTITKVTVSLKGFNHTFPDDVDMLLVSPTGRKMIIMSDAAAAAGRDQLNITLDDAAAGRCPMATASLRDPSGRPTTVRAIRSRRQRRPAPI